MNYKTHVSEKKKKIVKELTKLISDARVIGIVDMNNLPALQLQKMRALLRDQVMIRMTKKNLMRIAFENIKDKKSNIQELEKYLIGMPALIITNEDPFKLARILKENMSTAPVKAGQVAPNDITVKKGKTNFPPGPIISELSNVGIKAGIEGGKIAIKEDTVVAQEGEVVSDKVASVLKRLGVEPMKIGLKIVAAYEDGQIFKSDVLGISTEQVMSDMIRATSQAYALATEIGYITEETIMPLLNKAYSQARALSSEANIVTADNIKDEISKAETGAKVISEKINK